MSAIISTADTPEQYHAVKAVSNSGITKILRCPALFRAWQNGEAEEPKSDALLFGNVFHCLALEPETFASRYAVKRENGATKAGKEEKSAAQAAGVQLVALEMFDAAKGMAEAVRRQKLVQRMNEAPDVMREVSVYWTESVSGVEIPCKARIDFLATVLGFGMVTCDLKSITDASPEELSRSMFKWGYHRQAAWYRRALAAVGIPSEVFVLLAVEKAAPYIVTPANVAPAARLYGEGECERALSIYADCVKSGEWPCYTKEILELDLPEWVYRKVV